MILEKHKHDHHSQSEKECDHDNHNHHEHEHKHDHHGHDHEHAHIENAKWFWIKSSILVVLFAYFVALNIIKPDGGIQYTWHYGIWFPLTTYVVFWEGREYLKIYKQIWKRILNMDTLVGLASHILYIYSIVVTIINITSPMYSYDVMWEGAAILIVFTNIGHFIEERISNSSLDVYNKLNELKKSKAFVLREGEFIEVEASSVKVGETILIKRGGYVPLDGIAVEKGVFDYSNITGESKSIFVKEDEMVISGSFNLDANVRLVVSKTLEDSTINHVIEKIEEVSAARPPMQKFADKVLKYFIPTVILIAIFTFIIWLAIGLTIGINLPWLNSSSTWENAIKAGVTVIAIACPCALGIATPLVYTVSAMLAAKHGLIINEPKALEEINKVKVIAFDKTGTITSDKMKIVKIHGDKKYLPIAKALEEDVEHPIAKAIFLSSDKAEKVSKIKYLSNQGIIGVWKNKKVSIKRYVGNEFDVNQTNTNIALYIEETPKLVFELENIIKDQVKEVISKLQKMGIMTVMITGDNDEVAKHIATQVGIKKVYSNVSPNDKAEIIKELQNIGKVAFVGDGFNDAIAVKQSNVSFAFNSGSDITNSLSDVSITSGEFYEIYNFFKLGKLNSSKVKLSLTYAFAFNVISVPIAFLLLVQPWLGAAIMALSDILVALNALMYKILGEKSLKHSHKDGHDHLEGEHHHEH